MSEQADIHHPKQHLVSTDVEGFDSLAKLALDMRSTWNHATDQVWQQLDPVLWELTQNPWVVRSFNNGRSSSASPRCARMPFSSVTTTCI